MMPLVGGPRPPFPSPGPNSSPFPPPQQQQVRDAASQAGEQAINDVSHRLALAASGNQNTPGPPAFAPAWGYRRQQGQTLGPVGQHTPPPGIVRPGPPSGQAIGGALNDLQRRRGARNFGF